MLIDTHLHLDLMDNMMPMIQELQLSDVGAIAVGTTPRAFEREERLCRKANNIKVGLGFHPQLIAERAHEIDLFLKLAKDANYIGEIGLDFNSSFIESKAMQLSVFRRIVKVCAVEGDKVLSIHSVKAADAVIDELADARAFSSCTCIFHWFTGTVTARRRAVENGAYFSVNSRMLKTKSGQELVRSVPSNRLLLETDAPFAKRITSSEALKFELTTLVESISQVRCENCATEIRENSALVWEAD